MIIGLYSPAPQSGKSTIAHHLVLRHGYELLPFAQPLKKMARQLLAIQGLSEQRIVYHLHQDKTAIIEELGCTGRHLLQTLGTDWGRQLIHPDLWVRCWSAQAGARQLVVADDVRFLNEVEAVKALGGEVWKVWRPGAQLDCPHASEGGLNAWTGFNRLVVNDGDLAQITRDVDALLLPNELPKMRCPEDPGYAQLVADRLNGVER
jgi:hypothetical protein